MAAIAGPDSPDAAGAPALTFAERVGLPGPCRSPALAARHSHAERLPPRAGRRDPERARPRGAAARRRW